MNAIAHTSPSLLNFIDNLSEFARLPQKAQTGVLAKLDCVDKIKNAPHGQKSLVTDIQANKLNLNPSAVLRYVTDFNKKGWRALIDRRAFPKDAGRPRIFDDEVIGHFEGLQRSDDGSECHRHFITRLQLWRETGDPQYALAGYSEPPMDDPRTGHPYGWSLKSFQRLKIKGYEKALAKQGPKAASSFLPSVLTTRQGSKFLQRVFFDDQDYDNKIAVAGLSNAVRPVGFNCIDHRTAAQLGYHLRVLTKTDNEQTNKALTGKEFTWFALHFLQTVGYRTDEFGTELVFEWGTANSYNTNKTGSLTTFSDFHSFEDAIAAVTNGNVTINRSGKFNQPAFAGMIYPPSSTGNFKFKTWIESSFKLVRTYMQALPGPVGKNYQNAPEELYGIELEEKRILKAMSNLPPAIAETMEHEVLTYVEFAEILRAVYRAINARTDHDLEAWEECGFIRPLWRLSETSNHWMEREELETIPDADERAYLIRKVASNSKLTTTEQLSPTEAVQKEINDPAIKVLGREFTPLLIPKEWAIPKKVKQGSIEIKDPFFKKTSHQYVAQIETPNGRLTLKPGTEILCYHNPFDIDNLVITSADGSYLGTLTRTIPRQNHDQEATLVQLERRAKLKSDLDAAPRARAATIMEDRTRRRDNNRRLAKGDTSTAEERRSASALKGVQTRHTTKVNKRAQDIHTEEALDAWATPPEAVPSTDQETPETTEFNPFSE